MSLLTLVSTPIGNLEDLSARAVKTLSEADWLYAEDTRHTGRLLQHLGIKVPMRSCHEHNEKARAVEIARLVQEGRKVVLVSDAGTPGLADPGFRVVREMVAKGLPVSMIPGPSSILMALILSGFPTDRFVFDGWLPRRSGRLKQSLESYLTEPRTTILLESNKRLCKALTAMVEVLPGRHMAVCREMTKLHEDIRRGNPQELLDWYEAHPPKGEVVLVLEGAQVE